MKIKLFHKLIALLVLVSVVPLVAVSLLLIRIAREEVVGTVQQVHRLEAEANAARVRRVLQDAEERLVADLEGSVDTMLDDEIQKALIWMLGKQDNLITFRLMGAYSVDEGRQVGDLVRLPPESIPVEHRDHYLVRDEDVAEFTRRVPLQAAIRAAETQISAPYVNAARNEGLIAMAVPITDAAHRARWVVMGEVSLREVQRIISDVTIGEVGHAYLVDGKGRVVAHPRFDLVKNGEVLTGTPIVNAALSARQATAMAFEGADGVEQLGAFAPVYWDRWHLVVQQPSADAYAPITDMVSRAAFILVIALAASLALGYLYVRSLEGPLRLVMGGMRRIVEGQFDQRLDVRTSDEVGELAGAFNVMGRMLQTYRAEVEEWNRELQQRVEAKTRALEGAQAQLVRTSKLSALGQLGAGVAHELNNPLAGLVGQAALLRRRLRKLPLPQEERDKLEAYVQHIENESGRCREIVHGLLSFSQAGSSGIDVVNLNATIQKLLSLVHNNSRAAGVSLVQELSPDLGTIETNEQQVQQVLMHVLANAQQAMPEGGTVTVRTRSSEAGDTVAIDVVDTGRGIPPEHLEKVFDPFFTTKDNWQSTGLGLSVCYSIVESHGGRIEVQSVVGRGTTVTIILPRKQLARKQATQEPVGLRRGAMPVSA